MPLTSDEHEGGQKVPVIRLRYNTYMLTRCWFDLAKGNRRNVSQNFKATLRANVPRYLII
jgi:hypothetical protein